MTSILKNITAGAVVASLLVGCSGLNPVPKGSPKEILNMKNRIKYLNESQKDYQEVKISKHIVKTSDINHEGFEGLSADVNFEQGKDYTLSDVTSMIGFPVIVEDSIKLNRIDFNGRLKGDLSNVLNFIATLSDSYWTNKRGIIKFQEKKSIVYSVPLLSTAKTSLAFNAGSIGDGDNFDIGDIEEDVFFELKNLVKTAFNDYSTSGSITRTRSTSIQKNGEKDDTNAVNKSKEKSKSNSVNISDMDSNNKTSNKGNTVNLTGSESDEDISAYAPQPANATAKTKGKNKDAGSPSSLQQNIKSTNSEGTSTQDTNSKTEGTSLAYQNQKTDVDQATVSDAIQLTKNNSESEATSFVNSQETSLIKSYSTKSGDDRIQFSKESGIMQVVVTPDEEERIDNILKAASENMLSSLIVLDFFVIELEDEKIAEFNQNFEGFIENGIIKKTFNFSRGGLSGGYVKDTLINAASALAPLAQGGILPENTKTDTLAGTTKNYKDVNSAKNLNFMISYLTGDQRGEVLTQPKIVTLSNKLARLKEGVDIPYVKPGQLSGEAENVTYEIEEISTGIELGAIAKVLEDDHLMISLGIKINQYLGDKTLNSGSVGSYDLPIQAPKVINTTFRVRPGEIMVLGGTNKVSKTGNNFENLFIPTEFKDKITKKKFVILVLPRLTKFIERED